MNIIDLPIDIIGEIFTYLVRCCDYDNFKQYNVLKKKKVLMVQGSGFNWHDNNHFRMVFLPNEDDLKTAIKRFADYLIDYKKRYKK